MLVVIPFVVNAALNFVLGLLVAYVLGPEQFGLYAIGAALMVFVNAAAIDWLKLAAIRFYTGSGAAEVQAMKLSLDTLIAGVSIGLCGILLAAVAAGIDFSLPATLVAVAVATGVCAGLFDYTGAVLRAQMKDRAYARYVLVKNLAALVLMVGGAWFTQNAAMVLFGACLSIVAALMTVRRDIDRSPLAPRALSLAHVRRFATYALPLVGANVLMATILLANRSLLASQHGLAEAGHFALATDMGIKLFGALGAAMEIILLRAVVQVDETRGRSAAYRQIGRNLVIVLMVSLPVAGGFFAVLPHFEALFIPGAYRGPFQLYFAVMLPAFLALAVTQAGLNPLFMIGHRTLVATGAAACGLAANGAVLLWAWQVDQPIVYACGLLAAFVTILVVTVAIAARNREAWPPGRDLGLVVLALLAMLAVIWPLRGATAPWPGLASMIGLGAFVYVAVILAGNVAGLRSRLVALIAERRGG